MHVLYALWLLPGELVHHKFRAVHLTLFACIDICKSQKAADSADVFQDGKFRYRLGLCMIGFDTVFGEAETSKFDVFPNHKLAFGDCQILLSAFLQDLADVIRQLLHGIACDKIVVHEFVDAVDIFNGDVGSPAPFMSYCIGPLVRRDTRSGLKGEGRW